VVGGQVQTADCIASLSHILSTVLLQRSCSAGGPATRRTRFSPPRRGQDASHALRVCRGETCASRAQGRASIFPRAPQGQRRREPGDALATLAVLRRRAPSPRRYFWPGATSETSASRGRDAARGQALEPPNLVRRAGGWPLSGQKTGRPETRRVAAARPGAGRSTERSTISLVGGL